MGSVTVEVGYSRCDVWIDGAEGSNKTTNACPVTSRSWLADHERRKGAKETERKANELEESARKQIPRATNGVRDPENGA
ncbi:hypothetical protein ZHAS_00017954 [Anopheles sinensis]|uniref:Uncharacterized protein n=1 Tax=Anopheles sinensis TaxID=74873 RepID=A0A084WI78_ANOSI|nr:hypothetical protein ZHAS_00017954 [Anopheles sinensis]